MLVSTYRQIAYAGLVLLPIALFFGLYASGLDPLTDLVVTGVTTAILAALQFLQLDRIEDSVARYGGSRPMGTILPYEVVDDSVAAAEAREDEAELRSGDPYASNELPACPGCGKFLYRVSGRFCPYCGHPIRPGPRPLAAGSGRSAPSRSGPPGA